MKAKIRRRRRRRRGKEKEWREWQSTRERSFASQGKASRGLAVKLRALTPKIREGEKEVVEAGEFEGRKAEAEGLGRGELRVLDKKARAPNRIIRCNKKEID